MTAWYNEIDPFAAAWLRELIKAGHIADGVVDERSIEDVKPDEIREFTQCHFFAGIGVWSYALRRAGWSDDTPVWTGSCPCQPFSAAGKGGGFADERHLWPAFYHLIGECRPPVVLGEQVASKDGLAWFDLVQSDMEGAGYACGAVDTCAAGFGAPHIRQRLYWVAYAERNGSQGRLRGWPDSQRQAVDGPLGRVCADSGLANSNRQRLHGIDSPVRTESIGHAEAGRRGETVHNVTGSQRRICGLDGKPSRLANTNSQQRPGGKRSIGAVDDSSGRHKSAAAIAGLRDDMHTGPTNGFWRDVDWLGCRDGKWRPVEPGTFPLVDGPAARVGRLRGYGNAINAEAATVFTEEVMVAIGVPPTLTKESLI